jgi:thymidylate kinase
LWVAVFGPDGAGKSAVIEQLAHEISLSFHGIQQFHFRPMFRRQQKDSQPVTQPHGKPPRGVLASVFKLLYWLADCWYGYMVTIRPARAGSRLVIFDRYFDDILIDPQRYRLPKSSLWFSRLVVPLTPRPDLYVLLDLPAEVVQQRKPEVSLAESQRQRLAYRKMFRSLPNAFIVNTASPVDEVAQQVKNLILESLTSQSVNRAEVSLIAGC